MISGILASPGIAFGKALLLQEEEIVLNKTPIAADQIDNEIQRFFDARKNLLSNLKLSKKKHVSPLVKRKKPSLKVTSCCLKMRS